jgi:isoleucyl-tRNA synthetase
MTVKEKEEKLTQFWEKNKIFEKSVEQRPKSKQYVFYDGPPFATGLPHYGHILGLTSKDLFPRFWTMKGFRVERRWGWDCHGLPIENIAEKELGIKEKKEIEGMGIARFNEFCRSKVLFFANEWKKTVRRMGKWIEFDNSYKTMDNTYLETVWHIFKKLYENDYVYEGKKILLYCPRCETPLSNSEIAMDQSYKDVTEKTASVKFKLLDEEETYVLAWTTTPWTLIGNVALAVNEKLLYVKIKLNNQFLILAKDRLQEVDQKYEVIEEFKGKKLLKKEYEPLYHTLSEKKGHYIINGGDQVSAEEGTGIVHMAIYGEFDYEMIKKYDLPIIQHVGFQGKLEQGPEEWKDMWFKDADKKVLEDLKERDLLFQAKDYSHPYPFCYRCETPLFYNAVDSWFVDIQKIKPKLLEKNEEINWYPDHLKHGRFKYILETAPDWSISRNRFWATSIPVWKCKKCNHISVIGSIKELQEKAIEKVANDIDLHKHVIDEIHLKCEKCSGQMNRIPEVFDCWFESGSMPYAAKHYPFENKDWFKDNFPADFISEYIAQVRAWFYYMHVISVLLFDKAPFKNVVVSGNVLAADGTKMSKSKKNFPDPNLIFDKYGADALRFYLMSSQLMKAQDLNFNEDGVKEVYRRLIVLLNNVNSFYNLFSQENSEIDKFSEEHILDKWIVNKTNKLIRDVTNALEDHNTITACNEILNFVEDLSTWYVRRSRDRFKSSNAEIKKQAVKTLAWVLNNLSRLLAPITPFISEEIYQSFKEKNNKLKESVHLDTWPTYDEEKINEVILEEMKTTRELVSKALEQREKSKIPIRQALSKLTIKGIELKGEYLELIRDELNVKKVKLKKSKNILVELDTAITPELLIEGISRDIIRKVNGYRKELKLTIQNRITLYFETDDKQVKKGFEKHLDEIKESVQADKVENKIPKNCESKEIKINTVPVKIGIKVL